jgi:hypothetical protein
VVIYGERVIGIQEAEDIIGEKVIGQGLVVTGYGLRVIGSRGGMGIIGEGDIGGRDF